MYDGPGGSFAPGTVNIPSYIKQKVDNAKHLKDSSTGKGRQCKFRAPDLPKQINK